MSDMQKVVKRLFGHAGGETAIRHRSGLVTAIPSPGHVDVERVGNAIPVLAGEWLNVGDVAHCLVWQGGAISIGKTGSANGHTHDTGVVPSDVSYRHIQSTPSATWTIDHNLGFRPGGITVISSAGDVVIGSIVSTTTTQLVLEFSAAFAGEAHVS